MKQVILGAGVVALVAVLAFVLWFSGSRTEPEVGAQIAERGARADAAREAEVSADRSESGLSSAAPDLGEESSAAEPSSAGPRRELAGTFAVERANGRLDSAASGEFALLLLGAGEELLADVRVRAEGGRWRVACPAAHAARVAFLQVSDVQSGGRGLALLAPARSMPANAALDVRAREARPTLLHVVDARTGVELAGIELLHSQGKSRPGDLSDPRSRASARIAEGLASPIDLAALAGLAPGSASLLVGVPGYAWTSIAVEVGAGTERTVELEPGGELRLRVEGDLRPDAPVAVVLRRSQPPNGRPLQSASVSAPTLLVFDGLAVGEYTLAAELGRGSGAIVELGRVTVAVAAEGVSDATLVVAPRPTVAQAPLSGLLLVPVEWELESPQVEAQALAPLVSGQRPRVELEVDPADGESGFDAFRVSHAGLEVGRYQLTVRTPPLQVEFDLPPGGLADLRLVAPNPALLLVRLHEAETGAPVRPAQLFWLPSRDGKPFGQMEVVSYSAELDGYRIVTSPGEVVLMPDSEDGIELPEPSVPVPAGSSEAAVPAARQTELDIALLDAGVPQPFPDGWRVKLFRADEDEPLEVILMASTSLRRAQLPAGGRYRIEFDPFPGYKPLPTLEFEALHRQRSRIEVRLER